jgi:hypothetical protein
MRNRVGPAAAVLGALLALCVAGCGGSGGGSGANGAGAFTLTATKSCLKKAGYPTAVVQNQYFPTAGGNLRVHVTNLQPGVLNPDRPAASTVDPGYVFLVFAKNPAGALAIRTKALKLAAQSFEHQAVVMSPAALKRGVGLTKNVFYYSPTGALSNAERTRVVACLR